MQIKKVIKSSARRGSKTGCLSRSEEIKRECEGGGFQKKEKELSGETYTPTTEGGKRGDGGNAFEA